MPPQIDGAVHRRPRERRLDSLRELEPEIDIFARVPASSLVRLHMDPEGPTPAVSNNAMLAALSETAIESFLALTGPE